MTEGKFKKYLFTAGAGFGLFIAGSAFALLGVTLLSSETPKAEIKFPVNASIPGAADGVVQVLHVGDNSTYLYAGETGFFKFHLENYNREIPLKFSIQLSGPSDKMDEIKEVKYCQILENGSESCTSVLGYSSSTDDSVTYSKTYYVDPSSTMDGIVYITYKDSAEPGEKEYNVSVFFVPQDS